MHMPWNWYFHRNKIKVKALLDTGAEISCLSEDFYNDNCQSFEKCPKLHVTGKLVRGAFGDKNLKLRIALTKEKRDFILFI